MKSSVRRYALSEFGWNDKEPKSVSLIGKNQGFAFVSYVEGSLRGPGEEIDLRTDPNGSWILTGRSKQRLFIKAAAVHMLSAREFLPAKSQEFTWKTGAPRTKMLRQDEGCCFLTGLGGSFLGEGESINVTRDQDGFWYLEGPAKQSVVAYAVGIPFAEGFRPEINEYTWQAGEPVKMIDRNEGVCFLTSLRGNFGGQDAVGLSIHNDGHWYLEGRSSRLQAKAVSVSVEPVSGTSRLVGPSFRTSFLEDVPAGTDRNGRVMMKVLDRERNAFRSILTVIVDSQGADDAGF